MTTLKTIFKVSVCVYYHSDVSPYSLSLFQNHGERQTLVVVICDGEPSDGTHRDFFNCLMKKPRNTHVSIAECTDDERDMEVVNYCCTVLLILTLCIFPVFGQIRWQNSQF
jgi:uncharacterized protein YegL